MTALTSFNDTYVALLINFLLQHFDTATIYSCEQKSSNADNILKNAILDTIYQNEQPVVFLDIDFDSDGRQRNINNKRILNIFFLTVQINQRILHNLDRIYNQSNQYDVANLIISLNDSNDSITKFVLDKSDIISNTILLLPNEKLPLRVWNRGNHVWSHSEATNNHSWQLAFAEIVNLTIDFDNRNINVYCYSRPPSGHILNIYDQPFLIGQDAFVGLEIYKYFHAKPFYFSNELETVKPMPFSEILILKERVKQIIINKRKSITVATTFNINLFLLIFDLRKLDDMFLRPNALPINKSSKVDIKITPSLTMDNDEMDFLYPHDQECMKLLIPKRNMATSFIRETITSKEVAVFGIFLLVFWIIRLIIHRVSFDNWMVALIDTFGLSFSQSNIRPKCTADIFWILHVIVSSIFFMVMLSGLFFKNIMNNNDEKHITTVDEFLETDLDILMVNYSDDNSLEDRLSNANPKIQSRTSFCTLIDLILILPKENNRFAYAMPTSTMAITHRMYQITVRSFGRNNYYPMKEPLFCIPLSYQIARNSPLTHNTNKIIQGMIEFGLIGAYRQWTYDVLNLYTEIYLSLKTDLSNTSFTFEKVLGAMCVYAAGIGISWVVFIYELYRKFGGIKSLFKF